MLHVLPNKQNKADKIVRTVCCSPQVPAPLPRPSQERSHQPPQPISTATALQCSYSTTSAATAPPVQLHHHQYREPSVLSYNPPVLVQVLNPLYNWYGPSIEEVQTGKGTRLHARWVEFESTREQTDMKFFEEIQISSLVLIVS